jgi:hypothetical protein
MVQMLLFYTDGHGCRASFRVPCTCTHHGSGTGVCTLTTPSFLIQHPVKYSTHPKRPRIRTLLKPARAVPRGSAPGREARLRDDRPRSPEHPCRLHTGAADIDRPCSDSTQHKAMRARCDKCRFHRRGTLASRDDSCGRNIASSRLGHTSRGCTHTRSARSRGTRTSSPGRPRSPRLASCTRADGKICPFLDQLSQQRPAVAP